MAKGRKTGGRRPGSQNIRTRQREAAMREMAASLADAIPDAFRGDAHMLLGLSTYLTKHGGGPDA